MHLELESRVPYANGTGMNPRLYAVIYDPAVFAVTSMLYNLRGTYNNLDLLARALNTTKDGSRFKPVNYYDIHSVNHQLLTLSLSNSENAKRAKKCGDIRTDLSVLFPFDYIVH
jgi:hypothetical protein